MKSKKKAVELTVEEKAVLNILEANSGINLNKRQEQVGLRKKNRTKQYKDLPETSW